MCSSWNKHNVYFECTFHHFWKHYLSMLTDVPMKWVRIKRERYVPYIGQMNENCCRQITSSLEQMTTRFKKNVHRSWKAQGQCSNECQSCLCTVVTSSSKRWIGPCVYCWKMRYGKRCQSEVLWSGRSLCGHTTTMQSPRFFVCPWFP